MKFLSEVPGYQNKALFFLKFSDNKEHLAGLQERGFLFMNGLKHFIDLGHASGHKGMGDELEATLIVNNVTNLRLIKEDTGEVTPFGDVPRITARVQPLTRLPVFCCTAITADIVQVAEKNGEKIEARVVFTAEQKERFVTDFGGHVLVIQAADFLRRVKEQFEVAGLEYRAARVYYHDFADPANELLLAFQQDPVNLVFVKDRSLSYQMEYRLTVTEPELQVPFTFELGDMSEFTTLMPTQELLGEDMLISVEMLTK